MGRFLLAGWLVLAGMAGVASAEDTARASIGDSRLSAGDDVTLDEYIPGNAFLAGGRVQLANRVGGSAFVTGGEVTVTGSIGRKLYASGGDLRIEGEVEGKVRAAGGKVRVARGARLRSDVTIAGGSVEVEGEVGGDLHVYGESVFINGAVYGDLEIAAVSSTRAAEPSSSIRRRRSSRASSNATAMNAVGSGGPVAARRGSAARCSRSVSWRSGRSCFSACPPSAGKRPAWYGANRCKAPAWAA